MALIRRSLVVVGGILLVASCDSVKNPGILPLEPQYSSQETALPNFLLIDPQLFPYAERSDSVRAVKGSDATLRLEYQGIDLADEQERVFFELFITSSSLANRPNGIPLKDGQPIWVRVSLDPGGFYSVELQPAGMTFDAAVELTFSMRLRDFDGDGKVDDVNYIKKHFRILSSDNDGVDWADTHELSISTDDQIAHVKVKLGHFTRFAMATN